MRCSGDALDRSPHILKVGREKNELEILSGEKTTQKGLNSFIGITLQLSSRESDADELSSNALST